MKLHSHSFKSIYKSLDINLDELGCVMLDIEPLENMGHEYHKRQAGLYVSKNPKRKWINGWVADKSGHITLLYGLLENANIWQPHVEKVLDGWKVGKVKIESIGFFQSPYPDEEYYCIVAHIEPTPALIEGHNRIEFLPHINTFPGFKPHMTLCYIKKDTKILMDCLNRFSKLWTNETLKTKKLNFGYLPKR